MEARRANIVAEGVVAGLLGHVTIALVLVAADLVAGRWILYTPVLMATVLLQGVPEGCLVTRSATILLAYTSIHLTALMLFGVLGSWMVQRSQERPSLWFGALFMFVFVAWHLPATVLGELGRVEQCLSLWPPLLAGLAGALAMGVYLWRSHPRLRRALRGERYA